MASESAEDDVVEQRSSISWKRIDPAEEEFPGRLQDNNDLDDFEELMKAARGNLDPAMRSKVAVLPRSESGHDRKVELVPLNSLNFQQRTQILDMALKTKDMDNELFLRKVRSRLDRVGIELPSVEVRFEGLEVDAQAYAAGRELPSIFNAYRNWVEGLLQRLRLMRSTKKNISILKGLTGTIKPGRLTLLLGPPASGKTTLLKALSGKLRKDDLDVRGKVTFNGYGFDECVVGRTSAYVDQVDNHIAELTVRETLDFAARVQGAGFDEIHELRKREKEQGIEPDWEIDSFMRASAARGKRHSIMADYVMRMLGLEVCADTMIGSQLIRGISGGQKKRVTTGEIVVGPCKTLFMDEISTGLDSSTTYQIVRCIRNMVHLRKSTVCMSLLQPQRETYNLFDDVMLLAEGLLVYHGPKEEVVPFFEGLGFRLPPRKGTADFLQEITSRKDQRQYWADPSKTYRFIPPAEMARAFHHSPVGQAAAAEAASPPVHTKEGLFMKACMRREFILMSRHRFVYFFRIAQLALVAFAAATVFLRVRMPTDTLEDGRKFLAFIFFGIYFMNASAWSELSITLGNISVFYKQRSNLFYPVTSFSLPTILLRIPLSAVSAMLWTVMTYFVVGFAPDPGRFFLYFLIHGLVNQTSITIFRATAAIGRAVVLCNVVAFIYIAYSLMLCGFIISYSNIGPWLIWAYWINPLTYAYKAVTISEFSAPRWQKPTPGNPSVPLGTAILQANDLDTRSWWIGAAIGILIGYVIVGNIVLNIALRVLNELQGGKAIVEEPGEEDASVSNHQPALDTAKASTNGQVVQGASHGMVLPFMQVTVSFRDVRYFVPIPEELELLKGITGCFRPGVLTALMGASGAGKTTFLDLLAGRKTVGRIEGDIRVNGFPQEHRTFARVSGYVEQSDIHSPQATVEEALWFSARLRLSKDINNKRMWAFIHEVMELVELMPLRSALVGLPGTSGLSVEQRKRLTIAVELVANPSAVFMDEPTSGLDARAANIVMRVVRNIANGRTIVCTIHQPSIAVFEAFDELLLLKRGGEVIYGGPLGYHSSDMVRYFEAIRGVDPISPSANPATWMLEISTISAEQRLRADLADLYRHSHLAAAIEDMVEELSQPKPGTQPLAFDSEHAQPLLNQYLIILKKNTIAYWRYPSYNAVRFTFTAIFAVLMGAAFWQAGANRTTELGVLQVAASQYLAALIIGFVNSATVQPVIAIERTVFHREKAAGMYASFPYALAQGDVELPYIVVQTVIWSLITYFMMGFELQAGKFFWYLLFTLLTMLYYTFYGLLAVVLSPNLQISSVASTLFYAIWNLFSGFLITLPQMPGWWSWYLWLCPVFWSCWGLITTQLGNVQEPMTLQNGTVTQVDVYIRDHFAFYYEWRGWVILVLLAFVLAFRVGAIVAVTKLSFVKR
ncbi:ATP-binding cassette transporter [Coccomyxa subellipsoidea C-169]|uniref:ATP-binding cassette transporter n=1 Tax=Coccomyxa subellipsoidea (strain C-169) TaxID=574566 RepID=I0Z5Y4_COCSC|nr:ATP-binding cassette transporter [Coccomyxa subellipsoidea C-169]EIE26053.1 ATP-binding cassette transporter [Coccomyxa subellipsoidea C-169]|eukprot:XP_005650597.1 ATP-binding cassette transporter [Coccomyxa subellipsoidea C-169]